MNRDLAFVLSKDVPASRVIEEIKRNSPEELRSLQIFDVFEGGNLPAGFKSLALSLVFQNPQRTLKEVEITGWIDRMVLVLKQEFNAQLRS